MKAFGLEVSLVKVSVVGLVRKKPTTPVLDFLPLFRTIQNAVPKAGRFDFYSVKNEKICILFEGVHPKPKKKRVGLGGTKGSH